MGVLQAGVVLDTRILCSVQTISTPERLALHGALVRLLGTDLGATVEPWSAWRREHASERAPAGPEAPAPAEAPAVER